MFLHVYICLYLRVDPGRKRPFCLPGSSAARLESSDSFSLRQVGRRVDAGPFQKQPLNFRGGRSRRLDC